VHARGLVGRLVDGQVVWRAPGASGDATEAPPASAATADRAIDDLVRRWLQRNPQLRRQSERDGPLRR
jgi:hypothetical protein